ncbi:MAG: DUF1573 domain-containing protein [Betaproteobacteria bacterium]|nr:MAG: DUF1573 domain-containing protein [Betaproteobacteria bacterium]
MTRSATVANKRSSPILLIAGITLVAVALVVAVIAAKPGADSSASASRASLPAPTAAAAPRPAQLLTARESQFDFGSISMAAGKVSHRFWFRNEGSNPLSIQRIYTSCMCTTATFVKGMRKIGSYGMPGHGGPLPDVNESLAPGEAAYVDVVFDPAAHGPSGLGRTERVVTIERAGGERLQFDFVANVTP